VRSESGSRRLQNNPRVLDHHGKHKGKHINYLYGSYSDLMLEHLGRKICMA